MLELGSTVDELIKNIHRRSYTVGVVGLGYVGLPLALRFAESGFNVLGFDTDSGKTRRLAAADSPIDYISNVRLKKLLDAGRFNVDSDMRLLAEPDAIIICVPTPLTPQRDPDLTYVISAADAVSRTLRTGQLIVLESTTYPGTTQEVLLPRLEARGLRVGQDFFLAFSPEREDPGNKTFDTHTIPKVVGGATDNCREVAAALYKEAIDTVIEVSSLKVAEAAKILENIYRAVNIAMVNELKTVFDRMGIDIWEVIEAAKTKPFGYQPFYPGPGLGGHCIPIDPYYLTWKAREFNMVTRFIELAGEINSKMPEYVVQRLVDTLNSYGLALKGSRVLLLGVSYKRDVGDIRESPGLELIRLLLKKGAQVDYSDPFVPKVVLDSTTCVYATDLTTTALDSYDAVVVVTDHSEFPYGTIFESSRVIVDTRNALARNGYTSEKIVKA